jgi:hypothetical protein
MLFGHGHTQDSPFTQCFRAHIKIISRLLPQRHRFIYSALSHSMNTVHGNAADQGKTGAARLDGGTEQATCRIRIDPLDACPVLYPRRMCAVNDAFAPFY